MAYEEKKKVVEAVEVLKAFCYGKDCYKCFLIDEDGVCVLSKKNPSAWKNPKLSRWTPEDVALAKAMKGFGVVGIKKDQIGNVICYDADDGAFSIIYDYIKTFDGAECNKFVKLDTIINEAEE